MKFYIQNVDTGLVLDIKNANDQAHGEIIMFPYHGGSNQQWTFKNDMIYSECNKGLVLDINQSTGKIITYPPHGGPNQKWHFEGGHIIRSDTGKVMDVESNNRNAKASVIAWSKHGGPNQKFRRVEI